MISQSALSVTDLAALKDGFDEVTDHAAVFLMAHGESPARIHARRLAFAQWLHYTKRLAGEFSVEERSGMTLVIQVTQEHIDAGKRGDSSRCPLALAARDAGCAFPVMGLNGRLWDGERSWFNREAGEWALRFDLRPGVDPRVSPAAFEFEPEPESLDMREWW